MNHSKTSITKNQIMQKIQMIIGIILVVFWSIGFLVYIIDFDIRSLMVCIVFIAIGILLIMKAKKTKSLILQFKKYVLHISTDPSGSIEALAAAMGTSQDVVVKDIELMIQKKFFVNAYINKETNSIIIGMRQPEANIYNRNNLQQGFAVEYITINCKNCGGVNKTIKGQVCECDYCGSPLQ